MAIVVGAACRVTGRKGALLRAEAALTSALECTLPSASEVTVLEVTKLADGTARAKVASDLGTGFMSCKLLEPVAVHGAEFARPVRVLGLHGGGASAKVMEYQTLAVRKELGFDTCMSTGLAGRYPLLLPQGRGSGQVPQALGFGRSSLRHHATSGAVGHLP